MTEKRLRELTEKLQNTTETSEKLESLRELLEEGRLFKTDGDPLKAGQAGKKQKPGEISDRELEKLLADEGVLLDDGDEKLLLVKEAPGKNGTPELQTERMSIDDLVKMLLPGAAQDPEAAAKMRRKLRDLLWGKKKKKTVPDVLAVLLLARMNARLRQKLKRPFKKTEEVVRWERDTLATALKKAAKNAEQTKQHGDPEKYLKQEAVQRCLDERMMELAGEKTAAGIKKENPGKTAEEKLIETVRQIDAQEEKKQFWVDVPEEKADVSDKNAFWEKIAGAETERIMARLESILDPRTDEQFLSRVEDLIDDPGAREVRGLVSHMKEETLHALSDKVNEDPSFDLEGVLEGVATGDISAEYSMDAPEAEVVPEPQAKEEPEAKAPEQPLPREPLLIIGRND